MGDGGSGGSGRSMGDVFPCTEQGIRDAVAAGGGPHTFECDGPTAVATGAEIVIANDVVLDGQGELTIDRNLTTFEQVPEESDRVLSVLDGVTAELRGLTITGGTGEDGANIQGSAAGVHNEGTLVLVDSTVSGNGARTPAGLWGEGVTNLGDMTIVRSTISSNVEGILNWGTLALTNSTVSGQRLRNSGVLTMVNSTLLGDLLTTTTLNSAVPSDSRGRFIVAGTLLSGECDGDGVVISDGYNVESPGDSCGFDRPADRVNVRAEDLKLGPLIDNGGLTMTHALGEGSVAIDGVPAPECAVEEDQRGVSRPQGDACDIGAFESEAISERRKYHANDQ